MNARLSLSERERMDRFSAALERLYAPGTEEAFMGHLAAAASTLFPGAISSADEVNHSTGAHRAALSEPWPDYDQILPALVEMLPTDHPVIVHVARGGKPEPLMIHDFVSQRQWRNGRMYTELYRPAEQEFQLGIPIPVVGRVLGVGINSPHPFNEDDRYLGGLFQRHAIRAHTAAVAVTARAKPCFGGVVIPSSAETRWQEQWRLTPRETEVLRWVAEGKRDGEIGTILGNSQRTVQSHVGRILAKLGVETRTAATRMALDLL